MARHDKISPEGDQKIKELLLLGHSQSIVARATGVHERSVRTRRAELVANGAVFPQCECGRSVSHRGSCSFKTAKYRAPVARNPVRRVTLRTADSWGVHNRRISQIKVPPPNCSARDLIAFVERAIPPKMHPHIREDLVQDVLVAIIAGDLDTHSLGGSLPAFIRRIYEQFPIYNAPISLTDFEADERPLEETIPDDGLSPEDEILLAEDEAEYISNLHAIETMDGVGYFRRRGR